MADKYRTQDTPLTGRVSLTFTFPDASWFMREFLDAFLDMLDADNWQQVGTVTVDEAIQAANLSYRSMTRMIGMVVAYATTDPPSNVLPCNGTEYLRADYPELYEVLAPAFIVDNDHFVVPDLRSRAAIGSGTGVGLTERSLGDVGGEETHVLTVAEMATHNHSDSGHIHSIHSHLGGLALAPGELPVSLPNPLPESTSTGNADIQNAGSGDGHNNMPPFLTLNYGIVAW